MLLPGSLFGELKAIVDVLLRCQRAAFQHFPELEGFSLSNVAGVDTREALLRLFGGLR